MRGAPGRPGAPFACVGVSFPTPPLPESGGEPPAPLSSIAGQARIAVAGRVHKAVSAGGITSCRRRVGSHIAVEGRGSRAFVGGRFRKLQRSSAGSHIPVGGQASRAVVCGRFHTLPSPGGLTNRRRWTGVTSCRHRTEFANCRRRGLTSPADRPQSRRGQSARPAVEGRPWSRVPAPCYLGGRGGRTRSGTVSYVGGVAVEAGS